MRDLSDFQRIPSEAELRPLIPRRERFRPEPRILHRAEIAPRDDGHFDVTLPGFAPRRVHPLVAEAHRAMNEGEPIERVIDRAYPLWKDGRRRNVVSTLLRSYYLKLEREGLVEIPFEEPPTLFAERYERVKVLGRGGMGVAHLCRDRKREGALVVVKHGWGWGTPIERAERTSRREGIALALVDHPLIPGLVDEFVEDGITHLVRDFAPGRPIAGASGIAAMPPHKRLSIFRDMVDALAHLHARGMLYLDVKPDNFVLGEDGRARLIDLGLCRAAEPGGTRLRTPIGSRNYVSPEVTKQRRATPRSDVYGLGRVLFHLTAGERARTKWTGPQLRDMLLARGAREHEARLVAWMANEDEDARPTSAEALAAIEDVLREAPAPAAGA